MLTENGTATSEAAAIETKDKRGSDSDFEVTPNSQLFEALSSEPNS